MGKVTTKNVALHSLYRSQIEQIRYTRLRIFRSKCF